MATIEIIGFQPTEGGSKLPFFEMSVAAGIPIPVEGSVSREVDLNEFLVERPSTTFFAKIHGDGLEHVGIASEDILIVDSSRKPADGKIVVVSAGGELSVKIFRKIAGEDFLETHNGAFLPTKIDPYMEFDIVGTVTKIIHTL
ncbi:MAG: S24 family peptidase [Chloroflexota bacterium]